MNKDRSGQEAIQNDPSHGLIVWDSEMCLVKHEVILINILKCYFLTHYPRPKTAGDAFYYSPLKNISHELCKHRVIYHSSFGVTWGMICPSLGSCIEVVSSRFKAVYNSWAVRLRAVFCIRTLTCPKS